MVLGRALKLATRRRSARSADRWAEQFASLLGQARIALIDVGAAGEIQPRWARISRHLEYVGFEPDERSRELMLQDAHGCDSYEVHGYALWSSEAEIPYGLCAKPMCSSVLEPNAALIDRFPDPDRYRVVNRGSFHAVALDSVGLSRADFIKLDTQGSELEVLRGSRSLLEGCLGVECEVEFQSLYVGQPLFGSVAAFMVDQGFEFIDFVSMIRWERDALSGYGQAVFADALFMRAPEDVAVRSPGREVLCRYLAVCALYGRFDLAQRLLGLAGFSDSDPARRAVGSLGELQLAQRRTIQRIQHLGLALAPDVSLVAME